MQWIDQILEIEQKFGNHTTKSWNSEIKTIQNLLSDNPKNSELVIRSIYCIHNILVEEGFLFEERDNIIQLLTDVFNDSKVKFREEAEYLFFIGSILNVSEWHFGLKEKEIAVNFSRLAMEKEPGNVLYEWGFRSFFKNDSIHKYLAHQIIENDRNMIYWLQEKGFAGAYIIERLRQHSKEYSRNKHTNQYLK